jgi:hypothetical protein
MAKPSITKRLTKSAALTYSELDTNFQNLADATLTLRAGTGGTNVTADLNGTITLVAGTGVTLSGDNSAKTITVNSSAGGSGTVNSGVSGSLAYYPTTGETVDDALLTVSGTGIVTLAANGSTGGLWLSSKNLKTYLLLPDNNTGVTLNCADTGGGDLVLQCYDGMQFSTNAGGQAFLMYSSTSGGDYQFGIQFGAKFIQLPNRTTTQRNALTAGNGMMIYNITDNKFQGYANGSWVDLH